MKKAGSEPTNESNRLRRVVTLTWDHRGELGYIACTLALSFIGLGFATSALSGAWWWIATIGIAAIGSLAFYCQYVKLLEGDSNKELKQRIQKLSRANGDLRDGIGDLAAQYQTFFRGLLSVFADQELDYDTTERISVYRHDPDKEEFVLVARYSKDSELTKYGARASYPADEGIISKAWRNGTCTPEPLPDAETDLNEYLRITEQEWRIKSETAERFRMKSCCYAAYTLSHPHGAEYNNIAVMVFESKKRGKLKTDILEKQIRRPDDSLGPEGKRIAKFLISTEAIETRTDIASEEDV